MGVWIMNLIDKQSHDANTPRKFRHCKDMKILAIGWTKENPLKAFQDRELAAYKAAVKRLSSMELDDLIWVRDTVNKEYYICKVCGELECAPKNLHSKDIGQYRKAEWYGPVPQKALPHPLSVQRLISRPTIRRVLKPDVIKETEDFFYSTLIHKRVIGEDVE